jgi:hypothetical protein
MSRAMKRNKGKNRKSASSDRMMSMRRLTILRYVFIALLPLSKFPQPESGISDVKSALFRITTSLFCHPFQPLDYQRDNTALPTQNK